MLETSFKPELSDFEISFNNILRLIWNLPRKCDTGILLYCPAFLIIIIKEANI